MYINCIYDVYGLFLSRSTYDSIIIGKKIEISVPGFYFNSNNKCFLLSFNLNKIGDIYAFDEYKNEIYLGTILNNIDWVEIIN